MTNKYSSLDLSGLFPNGTDIDGLSLNEALELNNEDINNKAVVFSNLISPLDLIVRSIY